MKIGRDIFLLPGYQEDLNWHCHFTAKCKITQMAADKFGRETISKCLKLLRSKASKEGGLPHLQVFKTPAGAKLWIFDYGELVVAMLPCEY